MKNTKNLLVAMVAACSLLVGASSASASITIPGPAWNPMVTLPAGGLTFTAGGLSGGCPTTIASNVTSTGAINVSSFSMNALCGGLQWQFHTPWSGQITGGTPGHPYTMGIAASFKAYLGALPCEYTGTLSLPIGSLSSIVGAPTGAFTSTGPGCIGITFGGSGGTIAPIRTITGSL